METTLQNRVDLFIGYMRLANPELELKILPTYNGVKWKQFDQYIDKQLQQQIESYLGNYLSEIYWESSWQYVYLK